MSSNDPAFFHKRISELEEQVKEFATRLTNAGVQIEETRFALQAAKRLSLLVLKGEDPAMQKTWANTILALCKS